MKDIRRCKICGCFTEELCHCKKKTTLFLDGRRRLKLSKLISGLLRHYPEQIGVKLSKDGYVSISDLVRGIREKWKNKHLYQWVSKEHIIALAQLDPKGRFEIKDDKIRASYGHSIQVSVEREPDRKVKTLYHGTSESFLESIMKEGLKPMKRQWVHLTSSFDDAVNVGRRKGGRTVVLVINAEELRKKGIEVYKAGKNVYLVKKVLPDCIEKVVRV